MTRFILYALPLLFLLLALFGVAVEIFELEPQRGTKLVLTESKVLAPEIVLATWLLEATGLLALYLLAQGRCGFWWLDGLVTGWVAWIFRGPLLVITMVTATGRVQEHWWKVAVAWWVLYSICGLALAVLARRSGPAADVSGTHGAAGSGELDDPLPSLRGPAQAQTTELNTDPDAAASGHLTRR